MRLSITQKKVGILTFHFSNHNYGAVLQTFASFLILKKLGYNPQIINLLASQRKNILSKIKAFVLSLVEASYNFEEFRKTNLVLTKKIYSLSELKRTNSDFDIFYVGSDQVWRQSMAKDLLPHYFLDFVDNDKIRMSYAASFGTSHWEGSEKDTDYIKSLLAKFHSVSVREEEGVDICCNIFNIKAHHVLDPTLLLNENDYYKIYKNKNEFTYKIKSYVGYYMLTDRNCKSIISIIAQKQLKMRICNLYKRKVNILGVRLFRYRKVGSWLIGIKKSSFIITDSFHCMIFAIIFRKEFVCLPNERGGIPRIKNILKVIGLEDRYCESETPDFNFFFLKRINYNSVSSKLELLKIDSMNFLKKALVNNNPKN